LDTREFYERLGKEYSLDRYWTTGFGRNIHIARCKTFAEFLEIQSRSESKSPSLDLGCGDGTVSIWLARYTGAMIIGCDISNSRVARALARAERQGIVDQVDFLVCDLHALPFRLNVLSRIFSSEVFEHIDDENGALRQVFGALCDGGTFVLGVPQEGSLLSKLRYRFWYWRLSQPFGGGHDVGHRNKYTLASVWQKLGEQGFEVTGVRGIGMMIPFMPLHYLALWLGPVFWLVSKFGERFPATADMLVFRATKPSQRLE
jgi:ubiquinone/menaquinone biosynthesis C-methylase UbiE